MLLKRIQNLKNDKEQLALKYEQEEERLTNDLMRKLTQVFFAFLFGFNFFPLSLLSSAAATAVSGCQSNDSSGLDGSKTALQTHSLL